MVITSGHSWLETNWDLSIGNEYQSPKTIPFHKLHSVKQPTWKGQARDSPQIAIFQGFFHIFSRNWSNAYSLKLTLFQDEPILTSLNPYQVTFLPKPGRCQDISLFTAWPIHQPCPSHPLHPPASRECWENLLNSAFTDHFWQILLSNNLLILFY